MTRPQLTGQLSAEDFRSFYWLKEELVKFCREYFREHPGATLREAIRAWEEKKTKRRE